MTEPTALLLLPRLQVQNANAISGPLSWGFPSPTAFLGFSHALERRFSRELSQGFGGIGIVCHSFTPLISLSSGGRTNVFHLTRNPVGKDGGAASFVEEGRAHLEISLVMSVYDFLPQSEGDYLAEDIFQAVQGLRLAGGSILPAREGRRFEARWLAFGEDAEGQNEQFRGLCRRLLPGFALVQRADILADRLAELRTAEPRATALEALLDLTRLNIEPDLPDPDQPGQTKWGIRTKPGWLVPIPTGYAGLSPLYAPGQVANARDNDTAFRFVESIYSLGEWVSPHRMLQLQQMLWYRRTDPHNGLYRCINNYSTIHNNAFAGAV